MCDIPIPPTTYSPLEDPNIPLSQKAHHFIPWVAGYYERTVDLSAITVPALEQLKNMTDISRDPKYLATTARMGDEDRAAVTWPSGAVRCPTPLFDSGMRASYRRNLHRAVFDTKGTWAHVKVLMLWADRSVVYCLWAAKQLSDRLNEPAEEEQRRNVRIVKLEDANHFVSPHP